MNSVRRCAGVGLGLVLAIVSEGWAQTRQVVNRGQNLTLSATVGGNPPPAIQWRRNGLPIAGATNSSFTVMNATATHDTGWYQVVATNSGGTTVSDPIFVNVVQNPAQVIPWGAPEQGLNVVPPNLTSLVAVAAGSFHTLALRADGTVVGWGSNSSNQLNIPGGLMNVVAIAAGEAHSLALRSDRTVVAWGSNSSGQVTVPAAATNVVSIAAGDAHSVALRADGTVVAWGLNSNGQATVPGGLNRGVFPHGGAAGRRHRDDVGLQLVRRAEPAGRVEQRGGNCGG